jgi:hypothetical protein
MTAVITEPCLVPARQGPVLRGPAADRPVSPVGDRSSVADRPQAKAVRSWPLLVLAVPAGAEVWSGWVGIAQMTGFGRVSPLPGIWPSLHLDTTVTLPVGVEAYAAYALRAWLDTSPAVSQRTRRFARRSAIFSFALGMAGQVSYHLLAQAGAARAPWIITTIVSCLPAGLGPGNGDHAGPHAPHRRRNRQGQLGSRTRQRSDSGPDRRGPRRTGAETRARPSHRRGRARAHRLPAGSAKGPWGAPAGGPGPPDRPSAGCGRRQRVTAGAPQCRSDRLQRVAERSSPRD